MGTKYNDQNHTNGKLLNGKEAEDDIVEMEFDRLLKDYVGQGGRYQMFIAFILAWTAFPCSFGMMEIVFLNLAPTHYCAITDLSPSLSMLNQSELMNFSIPNAIESGDGYEPEACMRYDRNYAEATADDIQIWRSEDPNSIKTTSCSTWTYEKSRIDDTITTEVMLNI